MVARARTCLVAVQEGGEEAVVARVGDDLGLDGVQITTADAMATAARLVQYRRRNHLSSSSTAGS